MPMCRNPVSPNLSSPFPVDEFSPEATDANHSTKVMTGNADNPELPSALFWLVSSG